MKKLFKYVAVLVGVVAVLIVAAVVIVPMVFDPNDYKERIATLVEEKTGRKLNIEGDIKLSVFPWLGVDMGRVALGNAVGFSAPNFFSTEQMQVRVKLLPLLKKQVEMDTVRIDGLDLNLARNAEGKFNWDDLVQSAQTTEPTSGQGDVPAVAALAIGGVKLTQAKVNWNDAMAGSEIQLAALNLTSGALSTDKPIALSLEFDVQSSAPQLSGHIATSGEFGFDAETQIGSINDLAFNADLKSPLLPGGAASIEASGNAVIDQARESLSLAGFKVSIPEIKLDKQTASVAVSGDFSADLAKSTVTGKGLSVDGQVKGEGIPGGAMDFKLVSELEADLNAQTLALSNYRLTSGAIDANGSVNVEKLLSSPEFKGALNLAGFNPKKMLGDFGQAVPETTDPKALTYLELKTEFSGTTQSIALTPLTAKLDDTLLKGNAAISNFASPSIKLDLAMDQIDADRYLPPGSKKTASPGTAGAAAGGLPLETLRGLDLDTQIAIGKLKITGIDIRDIRAGLSAKDGLIKASPLKAGLYGGTYAGDLALDARGDQAKISLNEQLKGVQVGQLLKALAIETGDMDLSDAAGDLSLQAEVSGDPARQRYVLKGTNIKSNVTGKALPGGRLIAALSADLDVDLAAKQVNGTSVNAAVQNLKLPSGLTATGTVAASSLNAGLDSKHYKATDVDVDLKEFQLNAKSKSTPVKLNVKALDADMSKQTLTADGFSASALGLKANGKIAITELLGNAQVAGVLDVPSFNAKQMLAVLGQPPIQTADPQALTSISLQTTFKASTNSVDLNPLSVKLDDTKLDGVLSIANLSGPSGINFDLKASSINADRYLPPNTGGQAATPGAAAGAIPVDLLRQLDANGKLTVSELIISNLRLTDIRLNVTGKDGVVSMQPLTALLYDGSYTGNINIDARSDAAKLSVNEKLENINIGPLLRDLTGEKERLAGRGDVRIQATGSGKNAKQIKKSLNGDAAVVLRDGAVKGIDLVNMLCSGLQSVGLFKDQGGEAETKFADMTASATITNGLIENRDLEARSPLIRVGGAGTADLVSEKLDYLTTARLVGTCQGQGGLGLADLSGFDIPVRIRGTFQNISFEPDYSSVITQGLSTGLGKKLEEQLGKKVGVEGLGESLEGLLGGAKKTEKKTALPASGEILQGGLPTEGSSGEIIQEALPAEQSTGEILQDVLPATEPSTGEVLQQEQPLEEPAGEILQQEQATEQTAEQPKKKDKKKEKQKPEDVAKELLKGLLN